jgi:dinuclear metal center YbgI/SA1388 family protein
MPTITQIAQHLDDLLDVATTPDYSHALNGLQLTNHAPITKIAAAVDFSSQTIQGAIAEHANLLLVHHGMFWGGLTPIRGPYYTRLKTLIDHDIAVYAAHLPLDRHPLYGNNALLATELGLTPTAEFAHFKTIAIGVRGTTHTPTATLYDTVNRFAHAHGGAAISTRITPEQITHSWAICTGSGASSETLHEAATLGIDTLIVGEGPHHTAIDATELGITVIYAGHYATETLGVQALATHLSRQFNIPWSFIEAPTGL